LHLRQKELESQVVVFDAVHPLLPFLSKFPGLL
jgi:hypothetical protein